MGGAAAGALLIYLGLNFRIGSWWTSGADAYVPAAIAGAVTALLIRYLLSRSE